jgi:hypothetical protein
MTCYCPVLINTCFVVSIGLLIIGILIGRDRRMKVGCTSSHVFELCKALRFEFCYEKEIRKTPPVAAYSKWYLRTHRSGLSSSRNKIGIGHLGILIFHLKDSSNVRGRGFKLQLFFHLK